MKLRFALYALLLFVGLSACSLFSQALSGTGPNSPQVQVDLTPVADPIMVDVTVDTNRITQALIPLEGGSLSVTGADGTIYTLEIPADALLNEVHISMTPAAISGLPFGEGAYAVQLEPEGLSFNNFATLTIKPAQEIPIDQQIFFGYQADGENLSLVPPVVDSPEIKLQLLHFSGYGVTKGLLADIEPVRRRIGGEAEARLQSEIAQVLMRERQRQLLGGSEEGNTIDFEGYFEQYQEQVIKPRIAAAGESCAAGRLAIQTVLGFERQRQLLGMGDESSLANIGDLMDTVGKVCVQEEYELCTEEHIIHRMIPVWLGIERQYQLLGISDGESESEVTKLAKDLTTKCLTFELNFESEGDFDAGDGGGFISRVVSKAKLQFDPVQMKIVGQAPLVNESFEFRAEGCSVTSNRGGGTFEAISLAYISDTRSLSDQVGYVRDVKFTYYPGITSESFTVTCEDSPSYTSPPSPLWTGMFIVSHQSEIDLSAGSPGSSSPTVPAEPGASAGLGTGGFGLPFFNMAELPAGAGFVAESWEVPAGDLFARKEWVKSGIEPGLIETGTFKLYHRPGQ